MTAAPPRDRTAWILWSLAILGMVLVAAVMIRHVETTITDDSVEYVGLARILSEEQAFGSFYHPGTPELYRTPGYPLLISLFRPWRGMLALRCALCLHVALGLGAALLISIAARSQGAPHPWRWGALYLLSPVVLVNTLLLETEALFVLLIALGAAFATRGLARNSATSLVLSGFAIGAASLVRPIGIVLCFVGVLLLFVLARRPCARRFLLVWCIAALALPTAWSVRNGMTGGFWAPSRTLLSFPSSVFGSAYLAGGVEPMKTSAYDQRGTAEGLSDIGRAIRSHPARALRTLALGVGQDLFGLGEWTLRRALLLETGTRGSGAEGTYWSVREAGAGLEMRRERTDATSRPASSLARAALLVWSALSLLLVYGAMLWGARSCLRHRNVLCLAWMFGASALILASAGYLSNSRFRVPALPFVLLIAAGSCSPRLPGREARESVRPQPSPTADCP